jgi:hypothetical protein
VNLIVSFEIFSDVLPSTQFNFHDPNNSSCNYIHLSAVVEWLVLLCGVQEIASLNVGLKAGCPGQGYHGSSQSF